ncbi:alpha/beta fold hydrolase [Streptomyces avicenniae]|uniref:alpha/beta fold hydrolase n=1 Tax=Streptomyces avicenniae TaxID=500153 RepID=UPI000A9E460A|nr:alpha/beta fold hydrolase [Streptomyces avicenniae]
MTTDTTPSSTLSSTPSGTPDTVLRGSGPALLLAHGAGGGIAGNYGLVLDDLARDHTVIGPHYPGSGTTPPSAVPLELDGLADLLVATATGAGHERFTVIGESLGSAVAVRVATRHPERVSALVLTVGFATADPLLATAAELMVALDRAGDRHAMARFAVAGCLTDAQLARLTSEEFDALTTAAEAGMPPGTAAQFALAARVDVRAELAGVAVPVLAFVATADRLVLPASQRALAAGIPGARLVELPGAAHVLGEPDRAAWLGHVRDFLAQTEAR